MNKKGFTLPELVIVIVILAILGTIGMISYTSYLSGARDSERLSDIATISSALKLNKQEKGSYPIPGSSFNIVYKDNANVLAYNGKFDNSVQLSTMNKLPLDPEIDVPYVYSVTKNRQEFELATTLENDDIPKAFLSGDYNSVSVNILPSIVLAVNASPGANVDVDSSSIKNNFVLSGQYFNLPYTFSGNYGPVARATSISQIISELKGENLYWQNSDYRTCEQISEAGKSLGTGLNEYQLIDSSGVLTNTGCTL